MDGEPRLKAGVWVEAYLARLRLADIPVFLRARGDGSAGAVLVKANTLDGQGVLYQRSFTLDGTRAWVALAEGDDAAVEEALARQCRFDPDLWVLEVEDRGGRTLLGDPGLEA